MPPYQFGAYVGTSIIFSGRGADPGDKARQFTGVDEELNTKLYELLRRRD